VELTIEGDKNVCAEINSELFEWVIENLVKNALDAIDHKLGKIAINVKDHRSRVEIDVTDNGKGIDLKEEKMYSGLVTAQNAAVGAWFKPVQKNYRGLS